MKQKKKNKLFTFLCSFMPGAAEMYMGFMRMGISLMGLFLAAVGISMVFGNGILLFIPALIWCYAFFHARNLVASEEDEFQKLEDDFVWASYVKDSSISISNPMLRKWTAIAMIIGGTMLLWDNLSRMIYRMIPDIMWDVIAPVVDKIPEVVVSILLIYAGIWMMKGKKEKLDGDGK